MHLAVTQVMTAWLAAAAAAGAPSGEEILTRVTQTYAGRHATLREYSGLRQYNLRNSRFGLQAAVTARMTYREGEGKHFQVVSRSGSEKLIGIIEQLMDTEAEASRPAGARSHEFSLANYQVKLLGSDVKNGRSCYVLELHPKSKNKYLVKGKAWVDSTTFGIVHLEGRPAASISMWVGQPQIIENYALVHGFWLPSYTRSDTSSFLLGSSELEISYTGYQLPPLASGVHDARLLHGPETGH